MKLDELTKGFAKNTLAIEISGLTLNSNAVKKGDVFMALSGASRHGLEYTRQVVVQGASAILYEPSDEGNALAQSIDDIPLIPVAQLESKLSALAARFYNDPSSKLSIIGITGTNGKTSCSQFLTQMLANSVSIGTLGWGKWGTLKKTENTTPTALVLQSMLADCVEANTTDVSLEVSSHGIVLGRVEAVQFEGAVFTNLSQDHLDFHGSMAAYFQAKLSFLKNPSLKFVVVNQQDNYSEQIIKALPESVKLWTFTRKKNTEKKTPSLFAKNIDRKKIGLSFDVVYGAKQATVSCPFYGEFNVENILAVMTVLLAKGLLFEDVVVKACDLKPIAGRMEVLGGNNCPQVFVDYAHTPDALLKALDALKQHQHKKLSVVFGCGGNRDMGKREQMGRIACEQADNIILTDDNPRYEAGKAIIKHILVGCECQKICVINDREEAIQTTIANASMDECILIAGKGHEDYQEIKGVKHPFSDQAIVKCALEKWKK